MTIVIVLPLLRSRACNSMPRPLSLRFPRSLQHPISLRCPAALHFPNLIYRPITRFQLLLQHLVKDPLRNSQIRDIFFRPSRVIYPPPGRESHMRILMFRPPLAVHPPPMPQASHVDGMYNNRCHPANPFCRRWEPVPPLGPRFVCALERKSISVLHVFPFPKFVYF